MTCDEFEDALLTRSTIPVNSAIEDAIELGVHRARQCKEDNFDGVRSSTVYYVVKIKGFFDTPKTAFRECVDGMRT